MFHSYVLVFSRIVIMLVFTLSSGGKMLTFANFLASVSDFKLLPRRWDRTVAWMVVIGEITVVLSVAIDGIFLPIGFLLAAGLLTVFSLALVIVLRRKLVVSCACFGRTQQNISYYDVARNIIFILCSLAGLWALRSSATGVAGAEVIVLGCISAMFVVLTINLGRVMKMLRQPLPVLRS